MSPTASAADRIRTHLERVQQLRRQAQAAGMAAAVSEVKQLQAQRFRATYADLIRDPTCAPATRFFLDELYGVRDFAQRDAQFGRIAGALERLFPEAVAQLAVDLAETHALTEVLDHELARHWLAHDPGTLPTLRYTLSWRLANDRPARERQLAVVQHMGLELQQLTRKKTLRMGLRMMRNPARAAGLEALQHFLESGFDAFASLGDARRFLETIRERESGWITTLFDAPVEEASAALASELARAARAD